MQFRFINTISKNKNNRGEESRSGVIGTYLNFTVIGRLKQLYSYHHNFLDDLRWCTLVL